MQTAIVYYAFKERTVERWFLKFLSRDIGLEIITICLKAMIRGLAQKLDVSHSCVV